MKNLVPVSFEPDNGEFLAHVPLGSSVLMDGDSELSLRKAGSQYSGSIQLMRSQLERMEEIRRSRKVIPARRMWEFGDSIFSLVETMERMSFHVNGLYDHLTRDLEVRRMWLQKVVVFRRYIPNQKSIPASVPWGRCSASPGKTAKAILEGKKI